MAIMVDNHHKIMGFKRLDYSVVSGNNRIIE